MLRIKPIVALLLSITMIVSFYGCGNKTNNAQNKNETEFQAYCEPLTSDDIAIEGDVYYASSQILLTSVNDATYEDVEKLIKKNGGEIVGYISATGDYQIRFNDSKTFEELEQLVENLKNDALIEDASLAYVAQFSNEAINYINDPWIDADDPSDTSGSVWDEDNPDGKNWWVEAIDMPTVWNMDLSTQTVKVGIIDSMFDTTNEDLDENLFAKTWNNPTNDDGTCRVTQLYNDAVAAYEQAVSSGDQDAIDSASNSISNASHGTHVAGIIAAQADNGFGIAGVNQNVKLYGYSVLSDESTESSEGRWGSIFQYKCAIAHLLNEGVKVINISMGYNDALMGTQDGDSYWSTFTSVNSKSLESFLLKYIEAGNDFLIVKSAGNDSTADKKYDAGNDVFGAISNEQVSQRIIIVGATRYNTKYDYYPIADFSNTGSRVDVYAPGVDVLSDIPSNVTSLMSGTSMSTPVVTGLASLIWGINPDLSAEQVRGFILASTSATMFDLDDESFIIRDLINWVADPTAIVNADICVQLAQATIGNGNTADAEYGTVSGMVYAITPDGADFADINIEILSLYNEDGGLVSTVPLQDIAYRVTDDNTGDVSILNVHTYSVLVEPGTYTLKAEVDGYDVQSQQITIYPNEVVSVDFEFTASSMLDLDNLVTDAYVRDCTSMIDGGYGMTGMYRIPQINMAYGDVEKINSEIYDTFYPIIEDSISAMQEYGYPSRSGEVEYRWAVNGDILSLVISNFGHPTMTGNYYFTIYNISISTGLLVSDAEVISQAGFSPEDYKQRVKEVLGSRFWGSWDPTNENFEQASFVEFFNDALRKTLSDDNIAKAQPYINEKGQLCITASIYALAGGETYNDDLNMIDFEFLDYYADEATLLSTASNYDGPSDSTDYPASDFSADAVYRIGDVFQFGFYEQDGNTKNGTEPIQWRVLDSEQGKILVISVKAIECKQFHSKDKTVTWENSDLRQWLNNDFYQTAFSESERKSILLSNVSSESNPENNIDPGANTTDYIYIPSISEMQQYFKSNSDRKCVASKYAISRGAYAPKDQNYCTWWLLRNPGEAGDKVANVNTDGRIDYVGSRVESVNGAVRFMMWLELKESATPDETKPTESHDQTHKTGDYTIDDIKTNGYGFYIMYDDGTFDKYYSGSVLVWEGPRPMTYGADYIPESLIISSSKDDINRERIKKGKLVLVCSETNRVEYSLTPVEFSGNALSTTVEGKTAAMFLTKTSVNHWTSGRNIGWFGGGMYTIKIDDVPISEWTADLESTNNRDYLPLVRGQEMQISIAYGATMETFDCVVNLSYYFQNHDIEYDLILNATSDGYAIIDLSNVPSGEYLIHYSWWNTESRARSVLATHVVVE